MLMTKAGRTFWVMPKSTCHTSPRSGTPSVLLLVERAEGLRGQRGKIVVRQVVGHGDTLDDGASKLPALRVGELCNLVEDVGDSLRHGRNIQDSPIGASAGTADGPF